MANTINTLTTQTNQTHVPKTTVMASGTYLMNTRRSHTKSMTITVTTTTAKTITWALGKHTMTNSFRPNSVKTWCHQTNQIPHHNTVITKSNDLPTSLIILANTMTLRIKGVSLAQIAARENHSIEDKKGCKSSSTTINKTSSLTSRCYKARSLDLMVIKTCHSNRNNLWSTCLLKIQIVQATLTGC